MHLEKGKYYEITVLTTQRPTYNLIVKVVECELDWVGIEVIKDLDTKTNVAMYSRGKQFFWSDTDFKVLREVPDNELTLYLLE